MSLVLSRESITFLYYNIENAVAKTINVPYAYDAKIGCDTVEYYNTRNGYMPKVSRPKTEW